MPETQPRLIFLSAVVAALLVVSHASAESLPGPSNGMIAISDSKVEVWNSRTSEWLSPEAFWLDYATHSEGKFWGRSSEYPSYDQVNEHDTLLIEVQGGPCLMYFFHSRWRRAQDVRRWNTEFNNLLGCPRVFD
jgi:hypothetical protein